MRCVAWRLSLVWHFGARCVLVDCCWRWHKICARRLLLALAQDVCQTIVILDVSDGRRIRLTQVLYVPCLAINLLSVSQLAKNGIMTSFTKIGCTLLDTDDANGLLAEARIASGGLCVIPKAVHHAIFPARALAANVSQSSSQCLKPLSKEMQILWHARLGLVGFEIVRRAAHAGVTVVIDLTAHMNGCNCHTCLLQKASRRPFEGSLSSGRHSLVTSSTLTSLVRCRRPSAATSMCSRSSTAARVSNISTC
jgi:hypothetical protein